MAGPAERRDTTPLEAALERVGDRWSLLIVEALLGTPRRFNQLADAIPDIAPNILTDRLRRLERERIVVATPYQQRPPRMSYALTADGQRPRLGAALARRLGRARHGRRRPDAPWTMRDAARDALVLPDLPGRRRPPRRPRDADRLRTRRSGGRTRRDGYTRGHGRRTLGAGHARPRPAGGRAATRASADRRRCRRASRAFRRARSRSSPRRRSSTTTSCSASRSSSPARSRSAPWSSASRRSARWSSCASWSAPRCSC